MWCMILCCCFIFFFKQKTAYEMRISDWSSDVCSSDLSDDKRLVGPGWGGLYNAKVSLADGSTVTADDAYLQESIRQPNAKIVASYPTGVMQIGRASCRERVCQYV